MSGGAELQPEPWNPGEEPFNDLPNGDAIEEEYMTHRVYILAPHYTPSDDVTQYFNFPLNNDITHEEGTTS